MTGQFARHLCVNDSKLFHTSAVYAMALNTITLPFRMEPPGPTAASQERGIGSCDMSSMVKLVSCSQQKKVALLEAAVPGPALPGMLSILFHHFCSMPSRFYSTPSVT
jgi:hypothetical protein